jgi:pilus assembly protein Flp/PilA
MACHGDLKAFFKGFAFDARGATAIEYALIASLIAIVIVTGVTAVGTKLSTFFASVTWTP